MATALVDDEGSIQCGICCENYDQIRLPKFLTCYHTFCTHCLISCARDGTIQCPLCRRTTCIERGISSLTTNFYILPKMKNSIDERKQHIKLTECSQINWAKSITHRREAQTRLNMLHDSIRLLESRVIHKIEENNEKIAILQSLMEKPCGRSQKLSKCEERELKSLFEQSEVELQEAEEFQNDLASVESFSCKISLKNQTEDLHYRLKFMEEKGLSFENTSSHGPCIGAAMSVLTMILRLTKEANLWEPVAEEVASQVIIPSQVESPSDSPTSSSPLLGLLSVLQGPRLSDHCFIQFSVRGVLKKKVIIRLEHEAAPAMCSHFYKYCDGSHHLTYEGSPVILTNPGISLTAGQYTELNWTGDGMEDACDEEESYLADWSQLTERRGAVRMRHRGKCADGVLVSSEFTIICDRREQNGSNHGLTTVFAYVTEGIEICEEISHLNPIRNDVFIAHSGPWYADRS